MAVAGSGESKSALLRGAISAPASPGAGVGTGNRQSASDAGNNLPSARQNNAASQKDFDVVVADLSRYIDKFLQRVNRELHFTVDRNNPHSVITIVNSQTGNVVRRIPRQELMAIHRRISANPDGLIRGLLVSEEA